MAGEPTEPTVSIDQFTHRRSRLGPALLVIAAILVFVAILYIGTRPGMLGGNGASPTPSATPTAPRTTPSLPTGGEFANSIQFASDRLSGTFTINDSRWSGERLEVDVTISVDQGTLDYIFFAMDMESADFFEPEPSGGPSALYEGTIQTGERVSGTLTFYKNRGDTQIVLGEYAGRNLTMLAIKG